MIFKVFKSICKNVELRVKNNEKKEKTNLKKVQHTVTQEYYLHPQPSEIEALDS